MEIKNITSLYFFTLLILQQTLASTNEPPLEEGIKEKYYPISVFFNQYPRSIQQNMEAYLKDCRDLIPKEAEYRARYSQEELDVPLLVTDKFIQEADITGNKVRDYIIDYSKSTCLPMVSFFGKYYPYYIFKGEIEINMDITGTTYKRKAVLIDEGRYVDMGNSIKILENDYGYYDLSYTGEGKICGQMNEENLCWACLMRCTVIWHWDEELNKFIPIRHLDK